MDYYRFINSRDIQAYLREIKYEFSTMEKAFLVFQSEQTTINEKLEAYQYLIDKCDDCAIEKRAWTNYYPSLKEFLKKYIAITKRTINGFYSTRGNYVYTGSFCCKSDYKWSKCNFVTKDIKKLKDFIAIYTRGIELKACKIKKMYLDRHDKYIELYFDEKNNVFSIDSRYYLSKEENDIISMFEGMWFDIPTPFKKGDMLIYKEKPYWPDTDEYPLVLKYLTTWDYEKYKKDGFKDCWSNNKEQHERLRAHFIREGDYTDMCAVAYFLSSDGTFYHEVEPGYLNLEYYRGEIKDEIRTLNVLSLYMKEELDLEGLQKALSIIYQQEHVKEEMVTFHYSDETIELLKLNEKDWEDR